MLAPWYKAFRVVFICECESSQHSFSLVIGMKLSIALLLALLSVALALGTSSFGAHSEEESKEVVKLRAQQPVGDYAAEAIIGLWQGRVSFYANPSPMQCSSELTTCDASFAITGDFLQINYINCAVTGKVLQRYELVIDSFDGKQLTASAKSNSLCINWSQKGAKATVVMNAVGATGICPSTKNPVCSPGGSNTYVFSLTQADLSGLQGFWAGSSTGYTVDKQYKKCMQTVCTTSITFISANMVALVNCTVNGAIVRETQDLYLYEYSGDSFYTVDPASGYRQCMYWSQSKRKATMTLDRSTYDCPTSSSKPACSNSVANSVVTYKLKCTDGGCAYNPGISASNIVGIVFGVILGVIVLAAVGWVLKKRHDNSKLGSRVPEGEGGF